MSFLLRCHPQRTSGLPRLTATSAEAPPPHPLLPAVQGQAAISGPWGAGQGSVGFKPRRWTDSSPKSFDLILAATVREGCHVLHTAVDIEAQRRQVAVQGDLAASLGRNKTVCLHRSPGLLCPLPQGSVPGLRDVDPVPRTHRCLGHMSTRPVGVVPRDRKSVLEGW